jgi:hypothetical protein
LFNKSGLRHLSCFRSDVRIEVQIGTPVIASVTAYKLASQSVAKRTCLAEAGK